jgi:N-dimethylarginine dimethylaminohydrolase
MPTTYQSEYGELKSLLLKHPRDAFRSDEYIDSNWRSLNYLSMPDFNKATDDYEKFIEIFTSRNVEVQFLVQDDSTGMDSIYVRDASITTNDGMLICNMGKDQRAGEPKIQLEHYLQNGKAVIGSLQGDATIEGGDVAWLSEDLLAVARGYRTNVLGINQLKQLVKNTASEVLVMDSPHYKGPSDVFHLMSVLSPVDKDLAVVYSPLMTVPFRERLISMGINYVEVPDEEFDSLGSNVLAIAPRVCVIVKGNPITKGRLEAAGVEVIEFDGDEICLKGSGGPTCLTRPLKRLL